MSAVQGELAVSSGLLGWGVTKLRAIGRMRRALPPPLARSALVAYNRPRMHELCTPAVMRLTAARHETRPSSVRSCSSKVSCSVIHCKRTLRMPAGCAARDNDACSRNQELSLCTYMRLVIMLRPLQ